MSSPNATALASPSPRPLVECVIVAWRAENLEILLDAFRAQTVPCLLTVVTSGRMAGGAEVPEHVFAKADRVYRTSVEFGAFNRYVPSFAYEGEFIYFHDDDMLPGRRVVEHFLEQARRLGEFGAIGQIGRIFKGGRYVPGTPERGPCLRRVDMLVRGYFVPSEHLPLILESLRRLNLVPSRDDIEDDLILGWTLARHRKLCYLTSRNDDPETRMCMAELSCAEARSARDNHYETRDEFIGGHWRAEWLTAGDSFG